MSRATKEQVQRVEAMFQLLKAGCDSPHADIDSDAIPDRDALRALLAERTELLKDRFTLRLASEYGDDLGFVLWWHLPVCEPPEVDNGEALELTDNAGVQWYTHFSLLPTNAQIDAAVPKSEEKPCSKTSPK